MSKILVLGDIHGRLIWDEVVVKHFSEVDKIIFLGDYVDTHEKISPEQQLSNLEDILNFKEDNPNKVVLLRGNHDLSEAGYSWAECSGFNFRIYKGMLPMKDRFLELTQWIYIEDNIIFSHAGISKIWLDNSELTLDTINDCPPCEKFAFNGSSLDIYGTSPTQPCTWIRPQTLCTCNIEGYNQIIGHTPVKSKITNIKGVSGEDIWLCDALGLKQYIIIDNENVKIYKLGS